MATNDERTLRNILEKVELLTGERSDGSRRAVLISELNGLIQDLSDQNAEVKKSVTELTAQFNASTASFREEILVRADENSALSQIITTLKAQIGENIAEIQETRRALATKTMAMAEKISTLSAQVGDARANIIEESRVRVTEDTALAERITELTASVGDNSSAITEIQQVYADFETTYAADIERLESSARKQRVFRQPTAPVNNSTTNLYIGDIWFKTNDGDRQHIWTGTAWDDVSDSRFDFVSGVYRQPNAPEAKFVGDIWFDTNNGSKIRYWTGSTWSDTSDTRLGSIPAVFRQANPPTPTGRVIGDLWFESDNGDRQHFWNGTKWDDVSDGRVDYITTTFCQPNPPEAKFVGDIWFDTDDGNKCYYWTGTVWADVTINLSNYATTASVNEEKTTRANADNAVAQRVLTASAGTSRVYTQTTAPGNTVGSPGYPRQDGDVWFNTTIPVGSVIPAFTPYVWYNGVWNNNSSGTFTKYIGTLAAINTVASAAYNGGTGSALATYKNTVSTYWALRGTLGGTSNDILTVTGIRKADGSSPTDYKIRFGDGTATTTVEIYGNLIVNGSINVSTSEGTIVSPIAANAITQGVFNEGFGSVGNTFIYANTADDVFLAIAVYIGGDTNAIAGFNKNLRIQYLGANVGQPAPIFGFALSGVNNSVSNVLSLNYGTTSATTMVRVTAGTTGPVRFNATTEGLSAKVFLYVLRLSR